MRHLLVLLGMIFSQNIFAAGMVGHWQGDKSNALICDNGYYAACKSDLKINYDINSGADSKLFLQSITSCATPEPISVVAVVYDGFEVSGSSGKIFESRGTAPFECGAVDATKLTIHSDNYGCGALSVTSSYHPLKVSSKVWTFFENRAGIVEFSIPVTIFQNKCTIAIYLKRVFP
jgi:hypothetical protein